MPQLHKITFPGESNNYRSKRNELLEAELKLRTDIEHVASLRRSLPNGGKLKKDYIFQLTRAGWADSKEIHFSELFQNGKQSLFVYSFMYHPDQEKPCTSCTSILDGLNGQARHISDRVNFVVIAKAPIDKLRAWAESREWKNLILLSSYNNSFNTDYQSESPEGNQWPLAHVFKQEEDTIYHFYTSELLYTATEEGQNSRHVDMMWPLWNIFDLTPEGRGTNWYPKHSYI